MTVKAALPLIVSLLFSSLTAAAVPQEERDALIALFSLSERLAGSIGEEGSECSLLEVGCDEEQEHVVELWLGARLLSGEVPPEIGALTHLRSADLSFNQLTGLPAEIGKLTALTSLDLSVNELAALPAEIGALAALRELDLSSNQLARLPAEIGNLTALNSLDLYWNDLTHLPVEIGGLAALTKLDLTANELVRLPPEIGRLRQLRWLYLSENKLWVLPAEIGELANLQELRLKDNELSGLSVAIGSLSRLRWLDLRGNRLTTLPWQIGELGNLEYLGLQGNRLTALPAEIGELVSLRHLSLEGNQLNQLPAEIGDLASLTTLHLEQNRLADLPTEIGGLASLEDLYLQQNQLTRLPEEIGDLQALSTLDLTGNRLEQLPAGIGNLGKLYTLRLADNLLETLPPEIGSCRILGKLFLSGNRLTSIPAEIGELHLLQLDLSFNLLSSLPPEIADSIGTLDSLKLDHNRLTSIPAELGKRWIFMELAHNELSELPDDFISVGAHDLPAFIDLRHNRLTSLPAWITEYRKRDYCGASCDYGICYDYVLILSANSIVDSNYVDSCTVQAYWNGLAQPGWAKEESALAKGRIARSSAQVLPPQDLRVTPLGQESVLVSWTPILYTADTGSYQVFASADGSVPGALVGETVDKTATSLRVDGLDSGREYTFRVRTVSSAHSFNHNPLISVLSSPVVSVTPAPSSSGSVSMADELVTAVEGESKQILVRRTGGSAGRVSVGYSTEPETASPQSDYTDTFGTLHWTDGDDSAKAITVPFRADTLFEGDETMIVSLSSVGGAVLGDRTQTRITLHDLGLQREQENHISSNGDTPRVAADAWDARVVVWADERSRAGERRPAPKQARRVDEMRKDLDALALTGSGGVPEGTSSVPGSVQSARDCASRRQDPLDLGLVWARRYRADGEAEGARIRVSSSAVAGGCRPDVAMAASGRFVVVWTGAGSDGESVLARIFAADGTPESGELRVDNGGNGGVHVVSPPRVAMGRSSGRIVVTWAAGADSPESRGSIRCRFLAASGEPESGVLTVNESGNAANPEVAVRDRYGAVVVWQRSDGTASDISARMYDDYATPLGDEILVSHDLWLEQRTPSVVIRPDGSFLVVWQLDTAVYGRTYANDGAAQDGAYLLIKPQQDIVRQHSQESPQLAGNDDGDCAVTWQEKRWFNGTTAVYSLPLPDCAVPVERTGYYRRIDDPESEQSERDPAVALSNLGTMTVVYRADDIVEGDGGILGTSLPAIEHQEQPRPIRRRRPATSRTRY